MTELLVAGAVGAFGFVLVFCVDGATRPGYRSAYHPVSALALGERGWVQTANFVVGGALIAGSGVAVWRELGLLSGLVVAVLGLALVGSGLFRMDPMRSYPPGTPADDPDDHSRAHEIHDWFGSAVFAAFPFVPLVVGFALRDTAWSILSWVTAAACVVGVGLFGTAWEKDASNTGLVQKLTIGASLFWLAATLLHLAGVW